MDIVSQSAVESGSPIDGVHLRLLASGEQMNVQHYRIEPGASIPVHSHPHEQLGFVMQGTLVFDVDGEEFTVEEGKSYALAGDEPHGVQNRGDVPVEGIDVFSPPRDDPDWSD